MMSTAQSDRPVPAPRISLRNRKPPVPKRTLKLSAVSEPRATNTNKTIVTTATATLLDNNKQNYNYSALKNIHSFQKFPSNVHESTKRSIRRVKSLTDIINFRNVKMKSNLHRSVSFQLKSANSCQDGEFMNDDKNEEMLCCSSAIDDCKNDQNEFSNYALFEQPELESLAELMNSAATSVSQNLSLNHQPSSSSLSISSVAGYNLSSSAEQSNYLLKNGNTRNPYDDIDIIRRNRDKDGIVRSPYDETVNIKRSLGEDDIIRRDLDGNNTNRDLTVGCYDNNATSANSDPETVFNNCMWNPGYIGLEEYNKLAELSYENATGINGYTETVDNKSDSMVEFENSLKRIGSSRRESTKSENALNFPENLTLSGWTEVTVNKKYRGKFWVVVKDGALAFWPNDEMDGDPVIGPHQLKNLIYVGKNPVNSAIELHIRESLICSHWTNLKLIVNDVDNWILNIAKCIMPKNELLLYSLKSVNAGGCVWIRQGSACAWSTGWMFFSEHKLYYVLDNCALLFELDIRKFIGMKSSISKVDWCASVVGSTKGPFMLLQEGGSLFVQAEHDSATTTWTELLKHHMEYSSYRLEDSKLTSDDVPVIVDKCIKFISTYGLLQPGLYRRNGPVIEVRSLMSEFRKDAVNVHILPESDEMINVVADVLRLFFRQLDSPLIPYHIQDRLFAVANLKNATRLDEYHEILMGLPRIRIQTLRRVLDHLKDVAEHASTNLATIENIAKVFGPTLFSVEKDGSRIDSFTDTIQQVNIVKDLLTYYASVFRISAREMSIKTKMNMLQGKSNQIKVRADGFLVPVHILEKDNHTFNVQSSSNAEQVCEAARNRPVIRNEVDISNFALFEEIKCGQLERRVNPIEKMSSMITGRWLDWEPAECFFLFKKDPVPYSFRLSYPFADDVRIAEPGGKSFSVAHLKLEGGLVAYYNKALKKMNEWHTDDILWYIGHESSRKPPYAYTLTFILPKSNFKYKSKNIGYCVAFREATLRTQWLNAVVSSQQDFRDNLAMPLIQI